MDEALHRICEEQGLFLTREALRLGFEDKALYRAVRRGELHRVRHGAYTFRDIWDDADERKRHQLRARAAFRTAKAPVALSHTSAVLLHTSQVWNLDLRHIHLTRLDGRTGRKEAGVSQHRGKVDRDKDIVQLDRVLATSPARSALELMMIATAEQSLVVVNALLQSGQTTMEELKATQERFARWPGTLGTELVLRLADPRIESVGESRFWWLCWREGLPAPVPQFPVVSADGQLVARLDFAWPEYGVWLEFDGKGKYVEHLRDGETPGDVVFREKQREDLIRRLTGWRCIRITWTDLANPRRLAELIRRELAVQAA